MFGKKDIFLFTPWFMGVLFILFAMSLAFATFCENDFGAIAARVLVYNTKWFELIVLLMIVNLIGQIFQLKLYKRKKLTILSFHVAFILIIVGAGITRYFGFDGTVHIRENNTQNICTSLDKYLNFNIKDLNENILFTDSKKLTITSVKKEKYSKDVSVDDIDYSLKFIRFLPNAAESIVDVDNGKPMVSVLLSKGTMLRENIFLSEGEIKNVGGVLFGFVEDDPVDVRIILKNDTFKIQSKYSLSERSMMSQNATIHEKGMVIPFESMKIYKVREFSIVPEKLSKSGIIKAVNLNYKTHQTNKSVLVFELS